MTRPRPKKKTAKKKAGPRRRGSPAAPALPRGTALGLVLLRVWTGGFFLATAKWKLIRPDYSIGEQIAFFRDQEYVEFLQRAIASPPHVFGRPFEAYAGFLEHVMLPARGVFAPAILFFEALLGIGLVLGLGVRFLAALGVVMMLAFNLVKPGPHDAAGDPVGVPLFTVASANWPVTLILLLLALAAAGRIFGLDGSLRSRGPRWVRWMA